MIVMKYSITEKQNLIMRYHAGESVTGICLQSGVPRSTFYSWLKPRKTYYICTILDLYSRKVIAHKVSMKNSSRLINATFKHAYIERKPADGLIFHSDRGTQYTSHSFQNLVKSCRVIQSFSPTASPQHNAVMESFYSTVKREELYRTNYHSVQEFYNRLASYMDFYNTKRPHTSLNYKTPNVYEHLYYDYQDKNKNPASRFKS